MGGCLGRRNLGADGGLGLDVGKVRFSLEKNKGSEINSERKEALVDCFFSKKF